MTELPLKHVAEVLVLKLRLILHASLITGLLICGSVDAVAAPVRSKHVEENAQVASCLNAVTNQEANSGSSVSRSLRWLHDEGTSEVTPAVSSAVVSNQ